MTNNLMRSLFLFRELCMTILVLACPLFKVYGNAQMEPSFSEKNQSAQQQINRARRHRIGGGIKDGACTLKA